MPILKVPLKLKAMKINSMRPAIIFDIDNTLYNFVDFFGPAFRAMVHVISSNTGIPEVDIVTSFKRVYTNRGSLEYRYSVQELDVLADYNKAEKDELLRTAIVAFSKSRNLRLITYEGCASAGFSTRTPPTPDWLRAFVTGGCRCSRTVRLFDVPLCNTS